jgi:EAL domain-containing protein (putative c-di-GMP-specific phosphodiesterase class I)
MSTALRVPPQAAGHAQQSASPSVAPAFSYAFQPIVDTVAREVFSYEALIRGLGNEPAYRVLEQVPEDLKHEFDLDSRIEAIKLAARIGLNCHLNLNFLPRSLELCADSIGNTLKAATDNRVPIERIILEVTEGEVIDDHAHFAALLNEYRGMGVKLAIDDFGAGYSSLNLPRRIPTRSGEDRHESRARHRKARTASSHRSRHHAGVRGFGHRHHCRRC